MKVERVPIGEVAQHYPPIALAYATAYPRLASRFSIDYRDEDALLDAAREAATRGMDPEAADRVLRALVDLAAPQPVIANVHRLRQGAVAVVTGQQPGAALGPLYNVYKAVTAIRLAAKLEEHGVPAVPVFWNHSDDHHPADLGRVRMPDENNAPVEFELPLADDDRPLYERTLEPVEAFLSRMEPLLRGMPHGPAVLATLQETSRGTLSEWFARLMLAFFGSQGLVVLEPRHLEGPRARKVLATALEKPDLVDRAVAAGGEGLLSLGFKPPLSGPFGTNVYRVNDGVRARTTAAGEGRLSAGVALRLILQDSVLPTAAYVGGPNEISYIAQLKELYDAFSMRMPVVVPRITATLIEPRVARVAAKFAFAPAQLLRGADVLLHQVASRARGGVLLALDTARKDLADRLQKLELEFGRADPAIMDATRKTSRKVEQALDAFHRRVVEVEKQANEVARTQIEKLVSHLTPNGVLQERFYSPAYYAAMFGPALIEKLVGALDPLAFAHQMVWIG